MDLNTLYLNAMIAIVIFFFLRLLKKALNDVYNPKCIYCFFKVDLNRAIRLLDTDGDAVFACGKNCARQLKQQGCKELPYE